MAVKKATAKAPAKKAATTKGTAKGDRYVCGVCGLEVVVDETCGCAEVHEIVCCEKVMKRKATKAKTAKKA